MVLYGAEIQVQVFSVPDSSFFPLNLIEAAKQTFKNSYYLHHIM